MSRVGAARRCVSSVIEKMDAIRNIHIKRYYTSKKNITGEGWEDSRPSRTMSRHARPHRGGEKRDWRRGWRFGRGRVMGERGRVGVMRSPPARGVGGAVGASGSSSGSSTPPRRTTKCLQTAHPKHGVNAAEGGVTAAMAAPHAGVSVGLLWGGVRGDGRAYGGWAAVGRGRTFVRP